MKQFKWPGIGLGLLLAGGVAPASSQAAALSVQPLKGQLELSWPDQGPGKVYTVQHLTDLNRPRWIPLHPWDDWPIAGTAFTDSTTNDVARFYRLAIIERGRLVAVTHLQTLSRFTLNLLIFGAELTYGIDIPFNADYSVDVYRVEYETLDPLLGSIIASGALCVPSGINTAAPLFSYQHGTIHRRVDAPSGPDSLEQQVGQIAAAHGYVVAMPDYLGLGPGSTGLHPYVHRRSSATAVIDLLRAARAAVATVPAISQDVPQGLNGKLFLFGYSEGAYVTLAAQQELEQKHASEFTITASAPSDGPYDLSGTMADVMTSTHSYPSPNYLPYVLLAYNEIYPLFDQPAEVMIEPYATDLPPLFDGEHTGDEIDAAMPSSGVPSEILQPAFLQAFTTDPQHPFRQVLRENDLLNWAPVSPTRLYHCAADDIVPFANSLVAYNSFLAAGADPATVQLVDPDSSGTHATCLFAGVPDILNWFDSLR